MSNSQPPGDSDRRSRSLRPHRRGAGSSAERPAIFISTEPSDRNGWRRPRSSFASGATPGCDDRRRFRNHPWFQEATHIIEAQLSKAAIRWYLFAGFVALGAVAYFAMPYISRQKSRSVLLLIAVLAGLSLLAAVTRTVIAARSISALNGIHRKYMDNSTHEDAIAILTRYITAGEPYALYLRNFEFDARIVKLPNDRQFTYMTLPPQFEFKLASALRDELPLIALDNPAAIMRVAKRPIASLSIHPAEWLDWLQDLIWAASVIVVYCDAASEGLFEELQLIRVLNRTDVTVVVLSTDGELFANSTNLRNQAMEAGATLPAYVPLERDDERLSGFRYVLYERELDLACLRKAPGFRDLIVAAHAWRAELQRRLAANGHIFLNFAPWDNATITATSANRSDEE